MTYQGDLNVDVAGDYNLSVGGNKLQIVGGDHISEIDGAVVSKHWKDKGSKGDTLREAARAACKYFSNVLTPETNRLHHNHLHLDSDIGFKCDARLNIKIE